MASATRSGPIDARGIAATPGKMDVDVSDAHVVEQSLDERLDFLARREIGVNQHARAIKGPQRQRTD